MENDFRVRRQAKTLDIREAVIAPRSPWQNAYAERVIGSIRRECLDHVVVIGERHLLGILSKYVDYYNGTRTHLSLSKDAPEPRSVQPPGIAGPRRTGSRALPRPPGIGASCADPSAA